MCHLSVLGDLFFVFAICSILSLPLYIPHNTKQNNMVETIDLGGEERHA